MIIGPGKGWLFMSTLEVLTQDLWQPLANTELLPEHSDSTRHLNQLLSRLFGLDVKSVYDQIHCSSNLVELGALVENVNAAFELADSFESLGYARSDALRKVAQIKVTSMSMDNKLLEIASSYHEQLLQLQDQLQQYKENIHLASSTRGALGALVNDYDVLQNLISDRNLQVPNKVSKDFENYTVNQKYIDDIQKKIDQIKSRLSQVFQIQNPKKELGDLENDLKEGFFKSPLVKQCSKTQYVEGLYQVNVLRKQIREVLSNIDGYRAAYESVQRDISSLAEGVSLLSRKDIEVASRRYVMEKHGLVENLEIFAPFVLRYKGLAKNLHNSIDAWVKENPDVSQHPFWTQPLSDKVTYHARDGVQHDVREYVSSDNAILKNAIAKYDLRADSLDGTAQKIVDWVTKNIEYTSDPQFSNNPEEWLDADTTLQTKKGDCEDMANLLASLMRNAQIPSTRVRVVAGQVDREGHAWVEYQRETDQEVIILDATNKSEAADVLQKVPARYISDYGSRYFSFNDEHSWSSGVEGNALLVNPAEVVSPKYFSLVTHLDAIGLPQNFRYYGLHNMLTGDNGSKEWKERFSLFKDSLSIVSGVSDSDRQYFDRVAAGIDHAIKAPAPGFDVDAAKEVYDALVAKLT